MRDMCRSKVKMNIICGVILASGFELLSQSTTQPPPPQSTQLEIRDQRSAEGGAEARSTYLLGPDDQIVIHALNVPDLSEKALRLDLNGDIKMPMIGRIHAAGLTAEELEAELTKRLKFYLEEPEVAVSVAEFRSQPVSVIGEVGTPGVHQVQGRKTLIEILSLAGGLRPDAGSSVRITRRLDQGRIPLPGATDDPTGKFSIAEVDLKSLLEAKSPEKNIVICPHDVISVPHAEVVYVLGEVGKAGPVVLTEGHSMSVLEAVSSSGGVLRTAATANAKILRPSEGGRRRTEVPVDLKKILKGQADDLPLLAGDILFVPGSNSKRATTRAIEAALQVGILAGTYGAIR